MLKVNGYNRFQISGLEAAQKYNTLTCFHHLPDFDQVIEIGTWLGGMALMLRIRFDCRIYTFDISEWSGVDYRRRIFTDNGINYIIADVFESEDILGLLGNSGKTLLLCDGGHKENEFTFFAKYLKRGDFIGAHDYFPTRKKYDKKVWSTVELIDSHIRKTCKKEGLKKYKPKIFNKCVWTIRYKI